MALKKSELYSSLWQSCDELRGGMDASQYKDYVLVLLFIKYVSDKYAGQPYAPIDRNSTAPFGKAVMNCAAAWMPANTRTMSSSCCSLNMSATNTLDSPTPRSIGTLQLPLAKL